MNNSSEGNNFLRYAVIGLFLLPLILWATYILGRPRLFAILNNNNTITLLNKLAGYNIISPERYINVLVDAIIVSPWFFYLIFLIIIYLFFNLKNSYRTLTRESYIDFFSLLLVVLIGSIILLWSAFYNGYPLLYFDSGTYIINPRPLDRPVGYYLFILATTLRSSLWVAIFSQALLTSFLMIRISYLLLRTTGLNKLISQLISLGILMLVVITTDISKYVSWVMPDLFTSWIFLGGMLLFLASKWYDEFLSFSAIAISFLSHNSHILIIFLSLLLLSVIGFIYRLKTPLIWKSAKKLAYIVTLLTFSACILNFGLGIGFTLSHNKGNFIISKFIATGVLSKTLDSYGKIKNWRFYQYKKDFDAAIGKEYDWFLWDENSPIKRMGDWVWEDQREQNEIIFHAFKLYYPEILRTCLLNTLQMLICLDSNHGLQSYADSYMYVHKVIQNKYPHDYEKYLNSRQQRGLFVHVKLFPVSDAILQLCVIIMVIGASYLYIYKKEYYLMIIILSPLLFIFINAGVTGSLSAILGRYNGRVLWLISYCFFLSLFIFINKRAQDKGLNMISRCPKST